MRGRAGAGRASLTRRGFVRLAAGGAASMACGAAAGAGALALGGCSSGPGPASSEAATEFFAFDTLIDLKAYCNREMLDLAQERCEYFDQHFSTTIEGSDVWRINHAQGEPVEVAQETADVIERSLAYSEVSGGLFDVTIGAVSNLWDFDNHVKPDDAAIEEAVRHVGYQNVSVSGTTVELADPEAMVDLGGIAKGYIADDLASLFREHGVTSGIINLGGNVYALGTKPDGESWKVGVQDPNDASAGASGEGEGSSGRSINAYIECHDRSVVTSGLYERTFEQDGVTYYHILDPRTGYPVETDLVSSSISSERSIDGDAYATILFLLGRDAALDLATSSDGLIDALLCGADGTITTTPDSGFVTL